MRENDMPASAQLTTTELDAINLSGELWNRLLDLPPTHPAERQELQLHIHAIQHIVMARLAVRVHPFTFHGTRGTHA